MTMLARSCCVNGALPGFVFGVELAFVSIG